MNLTAYSSMVYNTNDVTMDECYIISEGSFVDKNPKTNNKRTMQ